MNTFLARGSLLLIVVLLLCGCETPQNAQKTQYTQRIQPLPPTAEILFLSNRDTGDRNKEIYAMDADGGNVTRITYTDEHHFLMGIDNTKTYLVVTKAVKDTENPKGLGDEDRKNLWILNLETGEETLLTDLDNLAEGDSFSPDSEWVVFWMLLKGEKTSDIYKIRRDGSDLTRLTNTPDAHEFDPAWSNNGKKIAYNYYDTEIQRFILKVMDADGTNVRTLYDGGAGVATEHFPPGNYDPSWSPDDQWIVFERAMSYNEENGKAGVWHIFKVRNDGSEVVNLSEIGGHNSSAEYLPSYSPDGQLIVFTSRYGLKDPATVNINIFIMDSDGGSLIQLTDSPYWDEGAIWIK